jgi:hypothetical protein
MELGKQKKDNLTLAQKLSKLNELVVDNLIEGIENGDIKPMEMQGAITLLKNNKVVQERQEESEADVIDSLVGTAENVRV